MTEDTEAAINKLAARDERQRAEIAKLRAEVERLREAVRTYDDMPLGHMHFDRQGTSGLNCELCRQQREHRDKARAALDASERSEEVEGGE